MLIKKYENAFGIKKIKTSLDLSNSVIYASNGVFKSSFAKSLNHCSKGENQMVLDRLTNEEFIAEVEIFGRKLTEKDIFDNILVYSKELETNNENYIKQLVTNNKLQLKLESINKSLLDLKLEFSKCLAQIGIKEDDFKTIYSNRSRPGTLHYYKNILDDILDAKEILNIDDFNFKKINSKPMSFLDNSEIRNKLKFINDSIQRRLSHEVFDEKFNDLTFETIIKSFNNTSFLNEEKKRGVIINGHSFFKIDEFSEYLNKMALDIIQDPDLQKSIGEFEKLIGTSRDAENLKKAFREDPKLYSLYSYSKKEIVLFALKYKCSDFVKDWESKTNDNIILISSIYDEAKNTKSLFEIAIEKYNSRFSPIFDIVIKNKANTLVDGEYPEITFIHNRNKSKNLERNEILNILSSGEKSALYIISFIVEYEYKKQNSDSDLLIIFDDIVETFDYSNRAGFIEYIEELIHINSNKIIILTHNYEFFIRVSNSIKDLEKRAAYCNENGIVYIEGAKTLKSEYKSILKNITDYNQLVAAVALSREISEFTDYQTFDKLTKFLHYKKDFDALMINDLTEILENTFKLKISQQIDKTKSYLDVLTNEIQIDDNKKFDVIPKMAVSIACRVLIEKNIIKEDFEKLDGISSNQTREIQRKYSQTLTEKTNDLLNKVLISTPEFIHINSFMVEPLVDIDPKVLKNLYSEIKQLD